MLHGIGLCKQQIAALVRDQGIGDSKEMRVFTRLSVVTEKKAQVYAIVLVEFYLVNDRIARLDGHMILFQLDR